MTLGVTAIPTPYSIEPPARCEIPGRPVAPRRTVGSAHKQMRAGGGGSALTYQHTMGYD